ncbi:hypothetical protein GJ700_12095 [Duganella sp. FT92W]|uniref:Uncharacterized protein n=1 Tax=Pseudoduganella rivuli TaxID=2666085 RepID=A0A7X2LTY0_9BURK|nr:hypothetical protein [Pseudoduganella rivuli]MRV72452.1 hypothetical protein [Pseudoduganella rivuli]
MTSSEQKNACREAISEWSSLRQLAGFATLRKGYCNSNNGTGVNYPEDLDPYQIEVEGIHIPVGYVLVFVFTDQMLDGGYELLVPEHIYLCVLADALAEKNHGVEAAKVRELAREAEERAQQINPADALRRG